MKSKLPVYKLPDFKDFANDGNFYANTFKEHVTKHHFVNDPHKHDFYLVFLFTSGKGKHEIDFTTYDIKPGALFFLRPGQMHNWKFTNKTNGLMFFHSAHFYEAGFTGERLSDYPFYGSYNQPPVIQLTQKQTLSFNKMLAEILEEYNSNRKLKNRKILALLNSFYIETLRLYSSEKETVSETYRASVQKLEELIDHNFKTEKSASAYARMLNITEKHINRMVQASLNKTTTQLIADRIILEAKRLLISNKYSIKEIGTELGYEDISYFIRLFKKHTGITPSSFLKEHKGI